MRSHRRQGFNLWVGKIPWRRKWQYTLVFLHGESHGQRSLEGYHLWGHKESDTTEWLNWTKLKIYFVSFFSVFFHHFLIPSASVSPYHFGPSVQFSSVTQLCPTPCDPMIRSTPGLPVHHQLPEFTQMHVHRVGDTIQPSHALSFPSPPAPNPSKHQGLFQWANSLHEVAKVLEFQLQHQSFQWTPRTDLLQDGLVGSPCSPRDSQESSTPQLKSINCFGTQLSL